MASRLAKGGLLTGLAALVFASAGCGVLWSRHKLPKMVRLPMQSATLPELVAILNRQANSITTVNARIGLLASTGGQKTGAITDYHEIEGYLLIRKPGDIRLIGQFSLFGTIFDMVSNGRNFELSIPPKSEFFTGENDVIPPRVKNPIERLRPKIILQALLINPIAAGEKVAAMNDFAETRAEYDLLILAPDHDGVLRLVRKVVFSRYDLLPREQIIYNARGDVVTRADYGEFLNYNGVSFPSQVVIERPREEYSIRLVMQNVRFNLPLTDAQFELRRPPGSKLVPLSRVNAPASGHDPARVPAPGAR